MADFDAECISKSRGNIYIYINKNIYKLKNKHKRTNIYILNIIQQDIPEVLRDQRTTNITASSEDVGSKSKP